MNKILKKFTISLFILFLLCLTTWASDKELAHDKIRQIQELEKRFPIKPHHKKLLFNCEACHEDQGADPLKYKNIGDKGCLSCHKSKEYLADRLKFMDLLKANPHNSIHDGPNLYCDECHMEHKKSINMCSECHENEVPLWMGETP